MQKITRRTMLAASAAFVIVANGSASLPRFESRPFVATNNVFARASGATIENSKTKTTRVMRLEAFSACRLPNAIMRAA